MLRISRLGLVARVRATLIARPCLKFVARAAARTVPRRLSRAAHAEGAATLCEMDRRAQACMSPTRVDVEDVIAFQAWWPRGFSHALYRVPEVDATAALTHGEQPLCPALVRHHCARAMT